MQAEQTHLNLAFQIRYKEVALSRKERRRGGGELKRDAFPKTDGQEDRAKSGKQTGTRTGRQGSLHSFLHAGPQSGAAAAAAGGGERVSEKRKEGRKAVLERRKEEGARAQIVASAGFSLSVFLSLALSRSL
jgi:hypothetical protein